MEGHWTVRSLAKMLGIPRPTLTYWLSTNMISAEHYGRGREGHRISLNGLLELVTLLELRKAGIPLQSIRKAVDTLREHTGKERPLATLIIVVIGDDIAWSDEGDIAKLISARRQPGQRLMILPIGEKLEELRHRLDDEVAYIG